MEVTEDDIEVDCLSLEDLFPLQIGESLGGSCWSTDFSFSKAKVFLEYGKCLSHFLLVLVNFSNLCHNFSGVPG